MLCVHSYSPADLAMLAFIDRPHSNFSVILTGVLCGVLQTSCSFGRIALLLNTASLRLRVAMTAARAFGSPHFRRPCGFWIAAVLRNWLQLHYGGYWM